MKLSAVLRSLIYHPDSCRRSPSKFTTDRPEEPLLPKDSPFKLRLNENTNSERGPAESVYDRRMLRMKNKYFGSYLKDKSVYNSTQVILEESEDNVKTEPKRVSNIPQRALNSISKSKGQLPAFRTLVSNAKISQGFNKSTNYDQDNLQCKDQSYTNRNAPHNFPVLQYVPRPLVSSRGQFKRKFSMVKHAVIEPVHYNKMNAIFTERSNRVSGARSSLKSLSTIRKCKYKHSEWNKDCLLYTSDAADE
eukprot:TRINITY_DN5025_c0_g3_i1.p1 TRINITY_DN5025_c0_g3~~TRINITY_DN5025_c0_g3_i1.p1  ORF type:complete len:249 (+),score=38.73 TRINITY_DN5025_c0_g3_i1:81-827(+)